MRGRGKVVTCASCGEVVRHHAKGFCERCYAKSRQREIVCIDCGTLRLGYRSGRCERCYRWAHTTVKTCASCGEQRPMRGPTCRRCLVRARSSGGTCAHCGRLVARLWGDRCARCAKSHWVTATCASCLGWSTSVEVGRCRGCREFERYNSTYAQCRSCKRQLRVNCFGRCRLCTVTRRQLHAAGDPDWAEEPGTRGGIQLFFGDLYAPQGRRALTAAREQASSARQTYGLGPGGVVQPRLFAPLDPRHPSLAGLSATLPSDLASAVARFGDARGWRTSTTVAVTRAMVLLVDQGSGSLSESVKAELRRLRLPVSRVREFLVDLGALSTDERSDAGWIDQQIGGLPIKFRAEVLIWMEVLEGRERGSRPRNHVTVRHYVEASVPVLANWSDTYASLREVTTDDVAAAVATLQGSRRVMMAIALRSLFKALKARRLIFVDPARSLGVGRFPKTPVLGLDAVTRFSLLDKVERTDHRLVILLAGVHALSRADLCGLRLDDVDLDAKTIIVREQRRPLDPVVAEHLLDWLRVRRQRWPRTANPYLLVSTTSAFGIRPVSKGYFTGVFADLPTTAAGLRADRLLAEATESGGDLLRLVHMFGLSPDAAMRYCAGSEMDTETMEPLG